MSASTDGTLRRQVRQRMEEGRLSPEAPRETLAGPGSNRACAVCDQVIGPEELEYETEIGPANVQHFHFDCYVAWFKERHGL